MGTLPFIQWADYSHLTCTGLIRYAIVNRVKLKACDKAKILRAAEVRHCTQVDSLPVIEGDPNDHSAIFTTLQECMRLSGAHKVTIVTFDLPILLKAVDIVKQKDLPIIPRLGVGVYVYIGKEEFNNNYLH